MIPCNKIEESITNIKNILADKCNILKNTDILLIIETIEAIERCLKDPDNLNSDIVLYKYQFKTESEQLIVRNNIGAININDVKTFIENNSSYLSEQLGYEVISNKVDSLNSNSKIKYPNVYAVKKALEELSLIPGPKGEDGLDGTKWYNSTGVPSINLGKIGDYYINLNTMSVFYKISNIEWLFIGVLKGDKGASAYQIAVENGFVGTEEEWLESLHGEDGKDFTYDDFTPEQLEDLKGEKGDKGDQGIQGPIGLTGAPGIDGNDGAIGPQGPIGLQGIQGVKGDTGLQGPIGLTGAKGDQGDAGPAGPKGDKGDHGIQGQQGEQGVKGDNGWTPIHVFESDGTQRQVKKLTDYIGGTGDKPTQNIGQYVLEGGYTADKSLATNFKGAQSDNLIPEYVHSGNKEVYISSIDYATNTFTSVGHGLVKGNRLGLNLLKQINSASQSPFTKLPVNTMVYEGFHIVNITTDTFQIATTNGGAPIPLINQSTLDLSFFRFEVVQATNLTFSNINHNDIEMKVVGGFARNPRYIAFKGGDFGFTSRNNSFNYLIHDSLWSLGGTYSISITTNDKEEVRQRNWNLLQFSPMFNNGVINEIVYSINNTQNSLNISGGFLPYNGTTIKIYKL